MNNDHLKIALILRAVLKLHFFHLLFRKSVFSTFVVVVGIFFFNVLELCGVLFAYREWSDAKCFGQCLSTYAHNPFQLYATSVECVLNGNRRQISALER